jgi:hypothetical protein
MLRDLQTASCRVGNNFQWQNLDPHWRNERN